MKWRAERCWSADRYRIRELEAGFVVEYEFASWFDMLLMRARQLCELGVHGSLEAAQRACVRHARRVKRGTEAA